MCNQLLSNIGTDCWFAMIVRSSRQILSDFNEMFMWPMRHRIWWNVHMFMRLLNLTFVTSVLLWVHGKGHRLSDMQACSLCRKSWNPSTNFQQVTLQINFLFSGHHYISICSGIPCTWKTYICAIWCIMYILLYDMKTIYTVKLKVTMMSIFDLL